MQSQYSIDELLDLEHQREEEEREFQQLLRRIEAVAANVKGLQAEQTRLQQAATRVNDAQEEKAVDEQLQRVREGVEELTVEYTDLLADKELKAETLECVKSEEKSMQSSIDIGKVIGLTEFRGQFKALHESLKSISDLSPFLQMKAKLLPFDEWEKTQKELVEQAKRSLHAQHGTICKIMNEVKFFTHDPAGWKRFVISIEKKTYTSILKCIQSSLETFLDSVRGFKEPMFSIVLKINSDGKLSFQPSVSEVINSLQQVRTSIQQIAAEVDRVPSRLNFNPDQNLEYKMSYSAWLIPQQPLQGICKRLESTISKLPDQVADFMCALEDEYKVLWSGDVQKWSSAANFGVYQYKLQVHWVHNSVVDGLSINTSNVQKTLLVGLQQSQTSWQQAQDATLQSIKEDERDAAIPTREKMTWGRDENLQMLNSSGSGVIVPHYEVPIAPPPTWQPVDEPKVGSASRMARRGRERSSSISKDTPVTPTEDPRALHLQSRVSPRTDVRVESLPGLPRGEERRDQSEPVPVPTESPTIKGSSRSVGLTAADQKAVSRSAEPHSWQSEPESNQGDSQRSGDTPKAEVGRKHMQLSASMQAASLTNPLLIEEQTNNTSNRLHRRALAKEEDLSELEFSAEKVLEELQLTPSQRAAIFAQRSVAVDRSTMGTSLKKFEVPAPRASTASPSQTRTMGLMGNTLPSSAKAAKADDALPSATLPEARPIKTAFVEPKDGLVKTPELPPKTEPLRNIIDPKAETNELKFEANTKPDAKLKGDPVKGAPKLMQPEQVVRPSPDFYKNPTKSGIDAPTAPPSAEASAQRTPVKSLERGSAAPKQTTSAGWDTSGFSRDQYIEERPAAAASASAAPVEKARSLPAQAAPSPTAVNPNNAPTLSLSLLAIYKQHCATNKIKPNSGLLKILPTEPNVFISEINMDYNYIGIKGIQPLLEILKLNRNLRVLNLKDNNLENAEIKSLCQVILETGDETLEVLDLSNNPVSLSGGSALIELATKIRTLGEIRLIDTLLQPKIIEKIQEITQSNKERTQFKR